MVAVKFIAMLVTGIVLGVGGGVLYAVLPSIIHGQVKENIQLREGTEAYDNWVETPIAATMKFYMFNVTNADDVVRLKAKPILQEVGPYTYKELRKKTNITWHDEDHTVSYRQHKFYYFSEEESNGKEDDLVTLPNIPVIAAISIARSKKLEGEFHSFVQSETLYDTRRVSEFLFEGYHVNILDHIPDGMPNPMPGNTFGIMYGQNGTDDGEYIVYTGVDDSSKFAEVKSWNNQSITNFWKNESCNMINGTDGVQFPPFVDKDSRYYMLVTDIGRSVYLDYEGDVKHEGITNYRFSATADLFADPALNPDNYCFCMNDSCPLSGLIGISELKFGAPIYVGGAHYLMAEPTLLDTVEGIKPDADKHKILLDIEPTTGIVMSAARRVMISIDMQPSTADLLNAVFPIPRMMHPILWEDEGATIDEASAEKFKTMFRPVEIGKGISYALIAIGILLAIIAVSFLIKRSHLSSSPSKLRLTNK